MSSRYKKLLLNTSIFAVGTFGSKVLQFLIIPIYTYVLTTAEYGKIDLFTTTISLVIPFSTLLIQEAIIRFLTPKEITSDQAVVCGLVVTGISITCSFALFIPYEFFAGQELALFFSSALTLGSYVAIFQNYLKAIGDTIAFTVSGLINTFSFLTLNLVLLLYFKMGMHGYLLSLVFSSLATATYITIKGNIIRRSYDTTNTKAILHEMIRYSLPLIPNVLMWWIMNAGDKYIINFFLGQDANGLYAISLKLATVLTTLFGIFFQAWQLFAIEENKTEDRGILYANVYSMMMAVLFIITILTILLTKPIFLLCISNDFFDAQLYSPLLCVSTVINCMATFWGVSYIISKDTKKSFTTTSVGAVINLVVNFLLIVPFGLAGVAVGTIAGYLVVLILRIRDTKKVIDVQTDSVRTVIGLSVIFGISLVYLIDNNLITIISSMGALVLIVYLYFKEVRMVTQKLLQRVVAK